MGDVARPAGAAAKARMSRWRPVRAGAFVATILTLSAVRSAMAVQPDEILKDPALEARARAISAQLRCLVCQNQSIDDSDAPLARDLRLIVREKLTQGSSDADIGTFLVERYGEFILLRPPFSLHTALLWVGPLAVLFGGSLVIWANSRRRGAMRAAPLTAEEKRALDEIVGQG